jgi:hypothetical protein
MICVGINYFEGNESQKERNLMALEVLSRHKDKIEVYSFNYEDDIEYKILKKYGVKQENILKRNSYKEIGNSRPLPYIKEILNCCHSKRSEIFGFINSDILLNEKFFKTISNFDAYIMPRSDISTLSYIEFFKNNYRVIYGGDQHLGADGFFFSLKWWEENNHKFPEDLILGETSWDVVYRTIIKKECNNYIEKRCLYHVYHNPNWNNNTNGARNNLKIRKEIEERYK